MVAPEPFQRLGRGRHTDEGGRSLGQTESQRVRGSEVPRLEHGFGKWFVLTTSLTPALSPRSGRIVCRAFEMSCDGIGRTIIRKIEDGRWMFPLRGERARVRADVEQTLQRSATLRSLQRAKAKGAGISMQTVKRRERRAPRCGERVSDPQRLGWQAAGDSSQSRAPGITGTF